MDHSSVKYKDSYTQIALGAALGLLTGFVTVKVGQVAAIAVGSSILLMEIAHIEGFVKHDWSAIRKIFDKSRGQIPEITSLVEEAKDFAISNVTFAVAFVGGTFIGIGLS